MPTTTYDTLQHDRTGAIVTITIDRQKALNALNSAALDDLRRAVLDAKRDDTVRVVIITGAGEKSFVAGADINELARLAPLDAREHAQAGQHVFDLIEHLGKPVIAAINGYALGGGCELSLACTFRIASESAVFGQPEIDLGLIPGYGGTQRLSRLVGRSRAMDLVLTGRKIKAAEALQIGLVDRVVPAASLMDDARAFAGVLAGKAPLAIRCAMQAITGGVEMPLADAQSLEATLFGLVASSEDMREGTRAFLEKRAPEFKGK
ncbi:MAG: enoyl-CoA hydratase-related protein [Bacteroidales bacterium]